MHPVSPSPRRPPSARTPLSLALSSLLLGCLSTSSWAQPVASAEPPVELTPITVTATKQGTSTFDTPASVSVIDGSSIERENLQHLNDVAQQLPNVYFADFVGGPATIVIRGMGYGDEESDVASIGVQIDGVPLPLTSLAGNLFDLEQIEVLRGPQSHGQGNIGGLVALRSRDPGFDFGGMAQVDVGTHARHRLAVGLDVPLAERTAIRISAGRDESDGHIKNVTLGRKDTSGWGSNFARLKLLHQDASGGELRLGLHHLDRNGRNDFFLRDGNIRSRESVEGDSGTHDITYSLFSGEYTRPLDDLTRLTVAAGASRAEWSYWTPTTLFGATNGYDMTVKGYHLETRVQRQASAASPFDWMAGVHLARKDMDRPYLYDFVPFFRSQTSSQVDATTAAAFAEAGWHFAPRWRVAAGLRLTHDSRKLDWRSDQNGAIESLHHTVSNNVWLPQLSLEYRPDAQQFAWVRVSRGYKEAGFNVYATQSVAAGDPYDPEYANQVEVGYRIQDANDRWQLGAVAFYTRLRDQQVVVQGLGGATMTDNAGRSHTQGLELDAAVRPVRSVQLRGHLGYVKAVYDRYVRGSTDYAGQQFAATPRVAGGASLNWQPAEHWEVGVSARHFGKVYLQTSRQQDDAYTLVDAHVSWDYKNWTIGLYGKNLTDARYLTRSVNVGMGDVVVAGAPRTVGLRVAYEF